MNEHRIQSVYPVQDFHLIMEFDHDDYRVVDMLLFMKDPVYESLGERHIFKQAKVDIETGSVVWPGGASIGPDVLYENGLPLVLPHSGG